MLLDDMSIENTKWKLNYILFVDGTVLLAESGKIYRKIMNEFSTMSVSQCWQKAIYLKREKITTVIDFYRFIQNEN